MINGKEPGAFRWRGKHVPIEYTGLILLEELYIKEPEALPVNRLMKVRGLGTQRRDRIKWIVKRFENLGWVEATAERCYRITGRGEEVYLGVGRGLLKFIRVFRLGVESLAWAPKKRPEPEEEGEPREPFSSGPARENGR